MWKESPDLEKLLASARHMEPAWLSTDDPLLLLLKDRENADSLDFFRNSLSFAEAALPSEVDVEAEETISPLLLSPPPPVDDSTEWWWWSSRRFFCFSSLFFSLLLFFFLNRFSGDVDREVFSTGTVSELAVAVAPGDDPREHVDPDLSRNPLLPPVFPSMEQSEDPWDEPQGLLSILSLFFFLQREPVVLPVLRLILVLFSAALINHAHVVPREKNKQEMRLARPRVMNHHHTLVRQ